MTRRKPNKACDVCGLLFPPRQSANTCGEDCAKIHAARRKAAYYAFNKKRIAKWAKGWRQENAKEQAAKAKARRQTQGERYNKVGRERKRLQNGTDPSKFIENRDREAMRERERERWRRGQAKRRAKLREAGHGPTQNL